MPPKRSKVYLDIYQLANLHPTDLGVRRICKLCGESVMVADLDATLDGFAYHLAARHGAHGGKYPTPPAKTTTT